MPKSGAERVWVGSERSHASSRAALSADTDELAVTPAKQKAPALIACRPKELEQEDGGVVFFPEGSVPVACRLTR